MHAPHASSISNPSLSLLNTGASVKRREDLYKNGEEDGPDGFTPGRPSGSKGSDPDDPDSISFYYFRIPAGATVTIKLKPEYGYQYLKGALNTCEAFAFEPGGRRPTAEVAAVVLVGSSSGHTGAEFPAYAASKGGVLAYARNLAQRLAPQATCNSVDPGGVLTELNRPVTDDPELWARVMALTPLRRWATPAEIAAWVYFVAVDNRFMTGQNLLVDGGEAGSFDFVWPE